MNHEQQFQRVAAITALLSVPFAITNFILATLAAGVDAEGFSDPGAFISAGSHGGTLMRWSWIADMFGYYLLLVPVALFLYAWLLPRSPHLVRLYTFCVG